MLKRICRNLRNTFRRGWLNGERQIREFELEQFPERENWTPREWQEHEFQHSYKVIVSSSMLASLSTVGSQMFYESGLDNFGNYFSLGAVGLLIAVWHHYRKIRRNPCYNPRNFLAIPED